ncbi:uncharacterized protein LOC128395100 [Panonychus citri]|uniref:uncharacterized protein LOC128395100 n=1 Tax=Panonychus citri TaxID=50023 RepID=UPI002306DED6|nr:uncharacterized protein LOC128395100 [Panonychus citri]XP_053211475.1 uncharacterized protein LOC128395100 [Panonychus citri]XP_053211476.1 uncharacterized protein LOC128395100 [Panonychus citri]XP_053211477.1 uncharacterized protein LOC128395100 [Panonychus citri]
MTLLATRIIALIVLFFLTLLMGIGPVILFRYWNRRKQAKTLEVTGRKGSSSKGSMQKSTASAVTLQLLMFFGGGVLLATCFVHLIPEVRENFDHYFHSKEGQASFLGPKASASSHSHDHSHGSEHDLPGAHEIDPEHHHHDHDHDHGNESNSSDSMGINYNGSEPATDETDTSASLKATTGHKHKHKVPYVELAICGGFFLIYFLEEIIHLLIGNHHEKDDDASIDTGSTVIDKPRPSNGTIQMSLNCEPLPNGKGQNPPYLVSCVKIPSASPHYGTIGYDNHGVDLKDDSVYPGFRPTPIEAFTDSRGNISPTSSSFDMLNKTNSSSASTTSSLNRQPLSVRFLRGFVTIVAFSAHSVFDGVAIGLQSTTSQLWTIFFAISMHKLVVAFAIGLELYEQTASLALTWIHMILFSIMSPIGILIVILTEREFKSQDSPVIILLSAVATGTILYIVFFEILQRDRCSKIPGIVQLFILVIGFTCMSCLTLLVDH